MPATVARNAASDSPARNNARRSCPARANRQVYNLPSAASRARVQPPQKGSVTELMKPTSPAPSRKRQRRDVEFGLRGMGSSGQRASIRATSSAPGTTRSLRQPLTVPTSMYSMKRTMCPVPRKRATRSSTPSSFTPRITTQLILIGAKPACSAAAMPASTCASSPRQPLQQHAIGGERKILDALDRRKPRHQLRQVAAQQRFATGQAQLAHAQRHEHPRDAFDFVEIQPFARAQERVVGGIRFLG